MGQSVVPVKVWRFRKEKHFLSCHELVAHSFVAMKNELWESSTAWRRLCIHFTTASGGYFHKTPEQSSIWVQKEGLLRIPSLNYSVLQLVYWSESITVFFKVRPYTPLPRQRTCIAITQHITPGIPLRYFATITSEDERVSVMRSIHATNKTRKKIILFELITP